MSRDLMVSVLQTILSFFCRLSLFYSCYYLQCDLSIPIHDCNEAENDPIVRGLPLKSNKEFYILHSPQLIFYISI